MGTESASSTHTTSNAILSLPSPLALLAEADAYFEDAAFLKGFTGYWSTVAPELQKLLLSYINNAFKVMGVTLNKLRKGTPIPLVRHLPKHEMVMKRLFKILEDAQCVVHQESGYVRGVADLPSGTDSPQLFDRIITNFPRFAVDARMMAVTGPQLGECLTGKVDPLSLMFRSPAASKVLEEFYLHSPVFATLTEHMISFLGALLNNIDCSAEPPLRIFEVGAGVGGTTSRIVEFIKAMAIPVEYTFTDISPSLVAKARDKYKMHAEWMHFLPFDMEKPVPEELRGKYHVVIGTMVVHATSSRSRSCSRLHDVLADGGIVVLSEGTQLIDWYDIAFGLLDGWWLSGDYALQAADVWMRDFREAGFPSCGYSTGPSREAKTQRLLLAWKNIAK